MAELEPHLVDLGPDSAVWPILGRCWSMSGHLWPKVAKFLPQFFGGAKAEMGRMWTKPGNIDQLWPIPGKMLVEHVPNLGTLGPISTDVEFD